MSDGIWAALSGAVAQERSLSVVANNVANVSTTGFRADRVAFREALSQAGTEGPAPDALRFVNVSEVEFDDRAGNLKQTGNPLDLALEGDGYFVVQTPEGQRYTRAGSFVTDAEGTLRTPDGFPVMGRPGDDGTPQPIVLPSERADISIGPDGVIHAGDIEVDQVWVVRFDGGALEKEGLTRFRTEAQAVDAYESNAVRQGMIEQANVNAVAGMHELITVSRSFEAFQKVIDTFQQLDERTARDVGSKR